MTTILKYAGFAAIIIIFQIILIAVLMWNRANPQACDRKALNCDSDVCIRVCCGIDKVCLNEDKFDELVENEVFKQAKKKVKIMKNQMICDVVQEDLPWKFLQNGTIRIFDGKFPDAEPNDYCIKRSNETVLDLLFFQDDFEVQPTGSASIYMLIVVPYMVIIFLFYKFAHELGCLHGKCVIAYVISVAIFHTSLAIVQIDDEKLRKIPFACTTAGYLLYTSIFVCFFWLLVMCFDVWIGFRTTRDKANDQKLFHKYFLFAFGAPLIITLMEFFIDISSSVSPSFKCAMGKSRCWIGNEWWIEFYYIYAPICLVLIVSITFYALTARKIYQAQHKSCRYDNAECRTHQNIDEYRVRFFLYFRLFIVMGVTWSIEIVLWLCKKSLFYNLSEIVNFLHLIIILSLFKWKPKIKQFRSAADRKVQNMRRTISIVDWIMSLRSNSAASRSVVKSPETQLDSILENSKEDKIDLAED